MEENEVKAFLNELCNSVITTLSEQHGIDAQKANIRIDQQNSKSKPVFALFEKTKFISRVSLKEIIHAGGGKGFSMIAGTYLKNIIRDLFAGACATLKKEFKDLFLLLYLKQENAEFIPFISLYADSKFYDSGKVIDKVGIS